jgi:hypothetical protein
MRGMRRGGCRFSLRFPGFLSLCFRSFRSLSVLSVQSKLPYSVCCLCRTLSSHRRKRLCSSRVGRKRTERTGRKGEKSVPVVLSTLLLLHPLFSYSSTMFNLSHVSRREVRSSDFLTTTFLKPILRSLSLNRLAEEGKNTMRCKVRTRG